jgi:hypothetical protein
MFLISPQLQGEVQDETYPNAIGLRDWSIGIDGGAATQSRPPPPAGTSRP